MEIYVQEFGTNQPNSIVFLHGGGMSGWVWDCQVQEFCDFHCLVPDLPEQGRSKEVKPFSIRDSAERISELIKNKAHGGKAHVVGHSLGAQILVQLLSTSPEVVDHAIVHSALVRRVPGMAGLIKPMAWLTIPFTKAEWFARIQAKFLRVPEHDFHKYFNDTRSIQAQSLENILRENAKFRLPIGVGTCKVPTLILVGQKELRVMRHSAKDLVSAMPNSQGYEVQGVTHNLHFEDPLLYNKILRAWLTNQQFPVDKQLRDERLTAI